MRVGYFTPEMAKKYAYFKIPKILFDERYSFSNISLEAKVLYGILLDRTELSVKNGWIDGENHVYVIFTREELMSEINCKRDKAARLIQELLTSGLIVRKSQGFGKPYLLYVMELMDDTEEMKNADVDKSEKPTTISRKNRPREVGKTDTNNTNNNKTDISKTDIYNTPLTPLGENEVQADNEHEEENSRILKIKKQDFRSSKGKKSNLEIFRNAMEKSEQVYMNLNPGTRLYQTYEEFLTYKDERKNPLLERTIIKQADTVEEYANKYGPDAVCDVINQSISNGYQGLFLSNLDKSSRSNSKRTNNWDNF